MTPEIISRTESAARIRKLHAEIASELQSTLAKAVEIGGLLAAQKKALPHGSYQSWVRSRTGIPARTARVYLRLFRSRSQLKGARSVTEAQALLAANSAAGKTAGPAVLDRQSTGPLRVRFAPSEAAPPQTVEDDLRQLDDFFARRQPHWTPDDVEKVKRYLIEVATKKI